MDCSPAPLAAAAAAASAAKKTLQIFRLRSSRLWTRTRICVSKKLLYFVVLLVVFTTITVSMLYDIQQANNNTSRGASLISEAAWKQNIHSMGNNVSRGYILAANIEQQMTQAVMCYGHLATLALHLNLSSVQPYVYGTQLSTLPGQFTHPTNLGTLFDLRSFKDYLRSCSPKNNHEMFTFDKFVQTASHEVILVCFLSFVGWYEELTYFSKGNVVEIKNKLYSVEALSRLNKWASRVAAQLKLSPTSHFRVVRTILIDARPQRAIDFKSLTDTLTSAIHHQFTKSGSATVLIKNWRGVHNHAKSKFFYYVPKFPFHCRHTDKIEFNPSVVNASRAFEQSVYTGKKARIGVHIRGEKLFQKYKHFEKCFTQLSALLKEIWNQDKAVYVFHDLGKYGTNSCTFWRCGRKKNRFLAEVRKLGFRVVNFDPVQFPSVPNNNMAYVAFVEREFLSRGDTLVTVGSGSYQLSIVQRFLHHSNHTISNVHRLCT